jgi:hypothetical protein
VSQGVCGPPNCAPKTCADLGYTCGNASDGCTKSLDCGTCTGTEICGGGGVPNVCATPVCVPKTCGDYGFDCGTSIDGCGGALDCGACPAGQVCGAGGTFNVCAVPPCVPKTCAQEGLSCGPAGDGCGAVLDCGSCPAGQSCGGSGTPGVCGAPPCVPQTCAGLGLQCGPAGDGCGNALSCGSCPAGQTCGGGGKPGVCGSQACVPKTCAQQNISCGPAGDGCGAVLNCGSCPGGQSCGGGGVPGVCGAPACTPKTCAQLGKNCGPVGDGCGNLLQCGTCNLPEKCGASAPNVCSVPATCTNLCLQQMTCPNNGTTSVTGTVYAPNGVDVLPNAIVYVPNAPVQPFTKGVTCDNCGAGVSGSPLVKTTTDLNGKFTLTNVPVGANIPLVIQIGRWRRQVTIPQVNACQTTAVAGTTTRLPRNKAEGDIPLMAFATGNVDALECVIRKIGVDDAEFTKNTGTGRVHLYRGSGATGANAGSNTPTQNTLVDTPTLLDDYDLVFFPCQGGQYNQTAARRANLLNYINAGGRLFATHFSYVWLYSTDPLSTTAAWHINQGNLNDQTGYIDQSFPKGQALAQWLVNVGASTKLGQIPLKVLRHDTDKINNPPSQMWMSVNDPNAGTVPMHYTFNTPVNVPSAQQCGRVVFDDFHVENVGGAGGTQFPGECAGGAMTAQEKLLEFMIFDLSSCVTPDVPTCTPKTCADQNIGCGQAGDGCGGVLDCGACSGGQSCGGGGVPNQCGAPACTPVTCLAQGLSCGPAGDGCGNALDCGSCPTGQTCGGGNKPGVCGSAVCTPLTCASQGLNCGPAGDGCGNALSCGTCPAGETCGGGGTPGVCGAPACTPKTCADLAYNCGPAADGCGGLLQCGVCTAPQTCGGGGQSNVCGAPIQLERFEPNTRGPRAPG